MCEPGPSARAQAWAEAIHTGAVWGELHHPGKAETSSPRPLSVSGDLNQSQTFLWESPVCPVKLQIPVPWVPGGAWQSVFLRGFWEMAKASVHQGCRGAQSLWDAKRGTVSLVSPEKDPTPNLEPERGMRHPDSNRLQVA